VDEIRPLMEVRDPAEGEAICGVLRAAGIKCNHAVVPDPNNALSAYLVTRDRIEVFVHASDMDRARDVVTADRARLPRD
jgi:hypothetical protein